MTRQPMPTIVSTAGMMLFVKYPYRQAPDVYVTGGLTEEQRTSVSCCQCDDATFPLSDLLGHIRSHDRRVGPAPVLARDAAGNLVVVKGFAPVTPEAQPVGGKG